MGSQDRFEIHIDGKAYSVDAAALTGAQIKEMAAIALGDQLFERREPSGDQPVFNDTLIQIHSGLKFYHLPGSITAGTREPNGYRPSAD